MRDSGRALRAQTIIKSQGAPAFYRTYMWRWAADQARKSQRNECQDCKARGVYAPAEEVHHIAPLLQRPDLALDQSNLVCLCKRCHEERHISMHGAAAGAQLPAECW
jgi:5-methylcytosine-specific restriction endonuclease McrA